MLLAAALMALAAAPAAEAGKIRLSTYSTTKSDGNGAVIRVQTTNSGDETAHDIQVHARLGQNQASSRVLPALAPGQTFKTELALAPELSLPGSYAIGVLIDFHDSHGRPFSNLSHGAFIHEEPVNLSLFMEPDTVELDKSGRLEIGLINTGEKPLAARLSLMLPRELSSSRPEIEVQIGPREKRRVRFPVENFSALAGSTYSVLVFMDYEDEGLHHALVSESVVRVVKAQSVFARWQAPLAGAGAALVLLALGWQVARRAGGRRRHAR